MIKRIFYKIHEKERALANSFGSDISTPRARLASMIHFQFMDHQILRHIWSNFTQIAPGAYRSNQPDLRHLKRAKRRGITTILNLRGTGDRSHYIFEQENCAKLGLSLHSIALDARRAADKETLLELIALFPKLDKPFMLHCKSGADRAGLASVIYLLTQEKTSLEEARRHLSIRYLHLKSTATGVLDHFLDLYAPHEAEMDFETWVRIHYSADEVTRSFQALRQREAK